MILSVLKNTDKTVKFWFIENFLSPSFLVSPHIIPLSPVLIPRVGIHSPLCRGVQLRVRTGDLQMAFMAPHAD